MFRPEWIIGSPDLGSIYDAPLAYHKAGLDQAVLDAFRIEPCPRPDLSVWEDVSDRVHNHDGQVKIAVVGKYTRLEDAYKSIAEALVHGGMCNRVKVVLDWFDAERLENGADASASLVGFDGILVPGGFGKRGTDGMIAAAKFARERKIPYLGICLGMQLAVIEAARNIGNIADAGSEEFEAESGNNSTDIAPVIYHLKEWIKGSKTLRRSIDDDKGGTMRLGAYDAVIGPDSQVAGIYNSTSISERHRHRYEVDVAYRDQLESCGMVFSGMSPDGRLPEIVELKGHPWYIGVQFHPELKSRPFDPHPLFRDFIRAAVEQVAAGMIGSARMPCRRDGWTCFGRQG